MESSKETVLITGITGYIGSWVGKLLLEQHSHKFKVRASVRDPNNMKKLEPLRQVYGDVLFNQIEFVELDLTNNEQMAKCIDGVQYIIHVANPIPGQKTLTEDEMVIPAKVGMEAMIEASIKSKVKKIIVTSSFATILGALWKSNTGDHHYTEKDIAPMVGVDGYSKSKIVQEKVIRDFLQEQETGNAEHKIEIITLHPTFVLGPTLIEERNSSAEGIGKIMRRDIPGLPELIMPSVDVRDVAQGHVEALVRSGLNGKRILLTKDSLSILTTAAWLNEEFQPQGMRVTTRRIGYCPMKIFSYFDQQVKMLLPLVNINITADNTSSKELLGINYEKDLKDTAIQMGYSLIDKGIVPDTRRDKKTIDYIKY